MKRKGEGEEGKGGLRRDEQVIAQTTARFMDRLDHKIDAKFVYVLMTSLRFRRLTSSTSLL